MDVLTNWRRLNTGEQTVLVTYMSMNYGITFAQRFMQNARRHQRPEAVINITNLSSFTPTRLQGGGYRLAGTSYNIEFWVHSSGNEIWVIRSRPVAAETTPGAEAQREPSQNPTRLDTTADPEDVYGSIVAERSNAEIIPGASSGYAIRYADGTIEAFLEGATGPQTYRPIPGSSNAYDVYDQDGEKVDDVIWTFTQEDIERIFGTTHATGQ